MKVVSGGRTTSDQRLELTMDLRDYALAIRRSWVIIVLSALLGVGVWAGISYLMPPKYESASQLYLSVRTGGGSIGDLTEGAMYSHQVVNSYVDIITSSIVLDPTVAYLDLDMTGDELAKQVSAESPADSTLINITAVSEDPQEAAAIASTVGVSFQEVMHNILEPETEAGTSPVVVTVTQEPVVPEDPVSPNIPLNLVLGLIMGLAVGVAIAVLRSALDNRLHTVGDVESVTDKPILGAIAYDAKAKGNPMLDLTKSQSRRAEAYRSLRTNLQYINVGAPHHILAVTSSNPHEGKTTTSLNLAAAVAQAKKKVAVVEGDLRNPSFAKYLDIEGGAGLTDVLVGLADAEDVLQQWGDDEFYILPAGRVPPNPSELLGSERMTEVLAELEKRFDYVIIDAPPVLSVTDAAVIGKQAAGMLVVVAAGSTTKHDLDASLQTLETAGVNVFGVVATKLPLKGPQSYRYGTYGAPVGA